MWLSAHVLIEKCGNTADEWLSCGDIGALGSFFSGAMAPITGAGLVLALLLQFQQLQEQRRELRTMSEQANDLQAERAFDAALAAFANKLVVADKGWNLTFKDAQIHFDRTAYETSDEALTVMKAEAELQRQLTEFMKAYREKNPTAVWAPFLHEGADEFLEIRSALLKLAATAEHVPEPYKAIADGLNLARFVKNVETITKGSYMLHMTEKYQDMNLPRWPVS